MGNHPPEERKCLNCGKGLSGKSNKMVCSKKCDNALRYKRKKDSIRTQTIKIFDKNYRVLTDVLKGFSMISGEVPEYYLLVHGFNFKRFTHHQINPKTGQVIYWTYDLGIEANKNGKNFSLRTMTIHGDLSDF